MTIFYLSLFLGLLYLYAMAQGAFYLNPAWLFIFTQSLIVGGTIPLIDPRNSADTQYMLVLSGFLIATICGSIVSQANSGSATGSKLAWSIRETSIEYDQYLQPLIKWAILFSIFVSTIYFVLVGYNLFLVGMRDLLTGRSSGDDIAGMRLAAYSGRRYLAPGYVNQFKNVILPALMCYVGVRSVLLNRPAGLRVAAVLAPVVIVFLVGTGQRGALVIAGIMCCIFVKASVGKYLRRGFLIGIAVFVVTAFVATSFVIRRAKVERRASSTVQNAGSEILLRVFTNNQYSGLVGFRYIYREPTQWGYDWGMTLAGLLPGRAKGYTPTGWRMIGVGASILRSSATSSR